MQLRDKTALLSLLVAATVITHGSSSRAEVPPAPELIKVAGQPVQLRFADGREAVMKVTTVKVFDLSIPFAVTENTCNEKTVASCKYVVPAEFNTFFFAWTKNPDPQKINQKVIAPGDNGSSTDQLDFTTTLSSLVRGQFPNAQVLKGIPKQTLVCPSLDWFEANDPTNNKSRTVRTVSTETALSNAETGVSENRAYATLRDVKLTQVSATTFEIDSAIIPKKTLFTVPFLFFGDAAWYVKNSSGDVCQFTSRADLTAAQSQFKAIDDGKTKPEDEKQIYIYGDTESDILNQIDSNLQSQVVRNAARAK